MLGTFRSLAVLAAAFLVSLPARAGELKVFIDGADDDVKLLLEKLNENGREASLSFSQVKSGYLYRIAVDAESATKGDILFGGGADAAAAVLTPECRLLFVVSRGGRGKKAGAMNALSKEIVKKLPSHLSGK